MPDPNQFMDAYIGQMIGGMVREAMMWRSQALAAAVENAGLKAEIAALKATRATPSPIQTPSRS